MQPTITLTVLSFFIVALSLTPKSSNISLVANRPSKWIVPGCPRGSSSLYSLYIISSGGYVRVTLPGRSRRVSMYIFCLLLALSHDIETNPGPSSSGVGSTGPMPPSSGCGQLSEGSSGPTVCATASRAAEGLSEGSSGPTVCATASRAAEGLSSPTVTGQLSTGPPGPMVCSTAGRDGAIAAGQPSPTVATAAGLSGPAVCSTGEEDWNCGICDNTCGWDTPAVACDDCGKWYHIQCQGISSKLYSKMDSGFAWSCLRCGLPNFSSAFFDISRLDQANRFSSLQDESLNSSNISSPGNPLASSSPINPRKKQKQINRSTPLRIITVNCESLRSQAKQALFNNMIENTKPDIIIGTETWLDNSIPSSEIFPDNFTVFRKDRQHIIDRNQFGPMKDNTSHGGVLVAIKSDIISSSAPEMDVDAEIIWTKINTASSKQVFIGSFYRQPRTGQNYLDLLETSLRKLDNRDAIIILGGDFNLPDIDWSSASVIESSTRGSLHQSLLDVAADHGLEQTVIAPTFDHNTLDLLFTNRPAFVQRTEVLPGMCRHHAILSEISVQPTKTKPKPRKIQIHKKADISGMKEELSQFRDEFLTLDHSSLSTEALWQKFKTAFLQAIDKFVPSKIVTPHHSLPWVSNDLRRLCKKRKRMYQNANTPAKKSAYREFSKQVDSKIKKSYFQYLTDLFTPEDEAKGWEKNKAWHNFLKNKKQENNGIAPLKENGRLYSDDKKKAEILNNQFFSVFNQDDNDTFPLLDDNSHPAMPDIKFDTNGIEKLLKDLKIKKAPGPDGIGARYLKEMASTIAPCLQIIFTKSYLSGETPSDWRNANVCPIYKKGERYNPANYRPVSLTSIISKLMEHCVVSNLLDHLEQHNILHPLQHGFRRRLSTETQLVTYLDHLATQVSCGKQVDAIVLDFSKAFDKVCHRRLLHKLSHYGVKGYNNRWIRAFLSGRHQQVVINQEQSEPLPVSSGVPQGSVLGPVLFLTYINDLPQCVSSEVRLFADDAIIHRNVSSGSDAQLLQNDLKSLEKWEKDWKMEFNPSKCNSISFTRLRNPIVHSYTLHDVTLEAARSVKYLGVHLAANLGWGEHTQNVVSKANRSLGMVRRNLKVAPTQIKAQAYLTLVRPHLEYSCTVWDPHTKHDCDRLEAVQRRAARFCTRDFRRLSSPTEMIALLGWTELAKRREQARLILMYKLCHSLLNINSSAYLTPVTRPTRHSHAYTFQRPQATKTYHALSFFPRTIQQWNGLPASLVSSPSVEAFSAGLRAGTPPK